MHPDTEFVNALLAKHLLGACVESFGLSHQVLTLTLRDDNAEDHIFSFDTDVSSNCQEFDELPIMM